MDDEILRQATDGVSDVCEGVLADGGVGELHLIFLAKEVRPWGVQPLGVAHCRLLLGKRVGLLTDLVILSNLLLPTSNSRG